MITWVSGASLSPFILCLFSPECYLQPGPELEDHTLHTAAGPGDTPEPDTLGPGWVVVCSINQADLELGVLLPQPPKGQNARNVPPSPAFLTSKGAHVLILSSTLTLRWAVCFDDRQSAVVNTGWRGLETVTH